LEIRIFFCWIFFLPRNSNAATEMDALTNEFKALAPVPVFTALLIISS
jgi:hypothetical protein